ncbi:MAG: hypothetical protein EA358_04370 [Flavobacteriales bacterium]|nr:MAG: hypothetical protein EA358_04370 [Flavobacteriales bacterium]
MEQQRFKTLLENPRLVTDDEVVKIRDLCLQSPFFSAAQMLYARVLFDRADYRFNKQLKWAALYCPNREILHDYVNDAIKLAAQPALDFDPQELKVINDDSASKTEIETSLEITETEQKEKFAKNHELDELEEVLEAEENQETQESPLEVSQQSDTKPTDAPIPRPEAPTSVKSTGGNEAWADRIASLKKRSQEVIEKIHKNLDEHQTEDREEVNSSPSSEAPDTQIAPVEQVKTEPESIADVVEQTVEEEEDLVVDEDENEKSEALDFKDKEEPLDSYEEVDFFTWLKQRSNQSAANKELKAEDNSKEKDSMDASAESLETATPVRENWKKVDAFLEKLPEIAPPKRQNLSEISISPVAFSTGIEEDHDLVTETLARVYVDQGHIEQAITAYEILKLKMPEKSSLFARQIQSLKKQRKK